MSLPPSVRTLMATRRETVGSNALNTRPKPPRPSSLCTRNRPICSGKDSDIVRVRHLYLRGQPRDLCGDLNDNAKVYDLDSPPPSGIYIGSTNEEIFESRPHHCGRRGRNRAL